MDVLRRHKNEFNELALTAKGAVQVDNLVKEIERLREEKEWLLNSYVQIQHMPNSLNMVDKNQIRGDIIRRMQQALKKNG